jgi:hypothetical protein
MGWISGVRVRQRIRQSAGSIRIVAAGALVQSTDRSDLLRASKHATDLLLSEGTLASVCAPPLAQRVSEFVAIDTRWNRPGDDTKVGRTL